MVAEANYGGRVTDPKDRRLIKILLNDFYSENILEEGYKFSESGVYFAPKTGDLKSYKDYIAQLPRNCNSEVFGLHENAQISSAIIETNSICTTVLSLLSRPGIFYLYNLNYNYCFKLKLDKEEKALSKL